MNEAQKLAYLDARKIRHAELVARLRSQPSFEDAVRNHFDTPEVWFLCPNGHKQNPGPVQLAVLRSRDDDHLRTDTWVCPVDRIEMGQWRVGKRPIIPGGGVKKLHMNASVADPSLSGTVYRVRTEFKCGSHFRQSFSPDRLLELYAEALAVGIPEMYLSRPAGYR